VAELALRDADGVHLVAPEPADAVEKKQMQRQHRDGCQHGEPPLRIAAGGGVGLGDVGSHAAIQQFCR